MLRLATYVCNDEADAGALEPKYGRLVVADMIGRNGHMRWPEALENVHKFWKELPQSCRYNAALSRQQEMFENWDCSTAAFEGIRAQDILPLLLERFDVPMFLGFGNVIDIFIDNRFGPHFDPDRAWDREFIDRVHAVDERGFAEGKLTPTRMLAVFSVDQAVERKFSRRINPHQAVHRP